MMRWILWIGGSLAGVVVLIAAFGAMLPTAHVAMRRARFKQAPDVLFGAITGPQDWRPQVSKLEAMPDRDGRRMWKEFDTRGDAITYEAVEQVAPSRYVTRIADPKLPFGGRWIFAIEPVNGGAEVRITEEGEIYNVMFRALAKLVFGYTSSLEDYLKALGAKFGEQVTPEASGMGLEAKCAARYGKQTGEGQAMWETDYLLFRGPFRVKIPRTAIRNVSAAEGALTVAFGDEVLVLSLGDAAEKWAGKILNPPSRLDKLGVKTGMCISVLAVRDDDFVSELEGRGANVSTRRRKNSDIVFAGAETAADLRFVEWRDSIQPDGAIWIVYPKGGRTIKEAEVRAAFLDCGLVDVKVCAFSPTLTAVKCVIPVAARNSRVQTAK